MDAQSDGAMTSDIGLLLLKRQHVFGALAIFILRLGFSPSRDPTPPVFWLRFTVLLFVSCLVALIEGPSAPIQFFRLLLIVGITVAVIVMSARELLAVKKHILPKPTYRDRGCFTRRNVFEASFSSMLREVCDVWPK